MKIALCDDDLFYSDHVKKFIYHFCNTRNLDTVVDRFPTGEAFLNSKTEYDIIFMDFEMPGLDGLKTAERIREKNKRCCIVFLSSHPEAVYQSFKVSAFRFILKSDKPDEIYEALESYIKSENRLLYPITVHADDRILRIETEDIIYIEANLKQCVIRTTDGSITVSEKIGSLLNSLPAFCFYQAHRSFIVNFYHIASIQKQTVRFKNGELAAVSRSHYTEFKKSYLNFIREFFI